MACFRLPPFKVDKRGVFKDSDARPSPDARAVNTGRCANEINIKRAHVAPIAGDFNMNSAIWGGFDLPQIYAILSDVECQWFDLCKLPSAFERVQNACWNWFVNIEQRNGLATDFASAEGKVCDVHAVFAHRIT
jgi:hypothetical protein